MLTLLENLPMLQSKTDQRVFRERSLFNAFFNVVLNRLILFRGPPACLQRTRVPARCGNAIYFSSYEGHLDLTGTTCKVQERALKAVPDLCETIDYAEVQGVLFPRVEVLLPSFSFARRWFI
jgi:hypothetical protein